MKTFDRTALSDFLREIDDQLTRPLAVTIVGGAVISLDRFRRLLGLTEGSSDYNHFGGVTNVDLDVDGR